MLKLAAKTDVVKLLSMRNITPLQMNVIIVLRNGPLSVMQIVDTIRKNNSDSYRFVDDSRFHIAVAKLCKKGYVQYMETPS